MRPNQTYDLLHSKETSNKIKRQGTEWDKIVANDVIQKDTDLEKIKTACSRQYQNTNNSKKKKKNLPDLQAYFSRVDLLTVKREGIDVQHE